MYNLFYNEEYPEEIYNIIAYRKQLITRTKPKATHNNYNALFFAQIWTVENTNNL